MFGLKRALEIEERRTAKLPARRLGRVLACARSEQGGAMVELALTLPILLLMASGMVSIGTLLAQQMQLTDAVNIAGKQLAISRGNTTDPCKLVYTTVTTAAPYLINLSSSNFAYTFNTTSYSGSSCSSTSTSTGAASNIIQGDPIVITVSYPCSIPIYGVPVPSGSCYIVSQITEMVQ